MDDEPIPCAFCGETATLELHSEDETGREFSVTICANCGSDE